MKFVYFKIIFLGSLALLVIPASLFANGVFVDPANTIAKDTPAGTVICALLSPSAYSAGQIKNSGKFLTYPQLIGPLKQKITRKSGAAKQKLKLKIKKLKKKNKHGKVVCASEPIGDHTPTPTPEPTTNFDQFGENVTTTGKINFGIPLSLPANVSQGSAIYTSMCAGCHLPELNRSFTEYREKTSLSPMLYDEVSLPNDKLAHLTAFLNRFNLP